VRNALKPLRIVLATARREGAIAHNSASEAVLPHRERIEEDEDQPRPFPDDKMELVVSLIHANHRAMFELLAATGVRRSELLAFEVRHLALDGESPHVKVRLRVRRRKGSGIVVGPLKSRHARRDLPIPLALADRLRVLLARRGEGELVFRSTVASVLDPDNLADRVLAPACAQAGVPWAGFHTFRHTVASRLFAQGRNVVQVQRWLGHHSPSFTLDTYVHLLDGDLGEPLAPLTTNSTTNQEIAAIREARVRHDEMSKSAISRTNTEQPKMSAKADSVYGTEGREFESLRARSRSLDHGSERLSRRPGPAWDFCPRGWGRSSAAVQVGALARCSAIGVSESVGTISRNSPQGTFRPAGSASTQTHCGRWQMYPDGCGETS
jgi:integrase